MNVFVLSTGRCGTTTFAKACEHLSNFSSAHESRVNKVGSLRLKYPNNHVEVDNRLCWFLGLLDEKYGNDAHYVHLIRERNETVNSYMKRFDFSESIIASFSRGILMYGNRVLTEKVKRNLCYHYYDTVNSNIRMFMKDKNNTMTIQLKDIDKQFPEFLKWINAKGNLESATQEWTNYYNTTADLKEKQKMDTKKSYIEQLIDLWS